MNARTISFQPRFIASNELKPTPNRQAPIALDHLNYGGDVVSQAVSHNASLEPLSDDEDRADRLALQRWEEDGGFCPPIDPDVR